MYLAPLNPVHYDVLLHSSDRNTWTLCTGTPNSSMSAVTTPELQSTSTSSVYWWEFSHVYAKKISKDVNAALCRDYDVLNWPLSAQVPSTDRNALSSLWGKLASEILMQNWEAAMEDLTRLRETIDNNVRDHSEETLCTARWHCRAGGLGTAKDFALQSIPLSVDCKVLHQTTAVTGSVVKVEASLWAKMEGSYCSKASHQGYTVMSAHADMLMWWLISNGAVFPF